MSEFFGELVGGIVEGFLDFIGRSKPDTMPEIEYKSEFTVKYKSASIFSKCLISIAIIIISVICYILTHHDTETAPLFIIFAVLGIATLFPAIYAALWKCKVSEAELNCREGFKKKKLSWDNVQCVRMVETTNQHSLTIAVYNKDGKLVIDCNSDMQNAWYIIKMAEQKEIEIRKEKDLSIKQLMQL